MIHTLKPEDAESYVELRREALGTAPLAFASSPEDDAGSDPQGIRQRLQQGVNWVIFGAFNQHLVGSLGLHRDPKQKAAHKAHLWGLYVTPAHRGLGLGRQLLQAALRHAASLPGVSWVHLSVSTAAPEARRLYESAGFQLWGTEPDALRHQGQAVADLHMALHLGEPSA
jgi:RimJ/RimL family protein N-acetyltransferase